MISIYKPQLDLASLKRYSQATMQISNKHFESKEEVEKFFDEVKAKAIIVDLINEEVFKINKLLLSLEGEEARDLRNRIGELGLLFWLNRVF